MLGYSQEPLKTARRSRTTTMSQLPSDILLGDIDALFCAVTSRLRCIADGSGTADHPDANDRIRAGVLDCVAALDQVHGMLVPPVDRPMTRAPVPMRAS